MLIVIPVGPRDAANLSLLAQAIAALGYTEHAITVVTVPSLLEEVEKHGFASVCTEDEFDQPWPIGPDRMWLWTVRYLDSIGNTQPWLWLEPDACPVQKGWDVKLAAAYEEAGKPFFGFTRPVKWKSPEGVITLMEKDPMMLGVAIYPPRMTSDQDLLPLLNDLGHSTPGAHPPEPFDMYLRYHMFRRGVHSTTLIYDRWRTRGYVRDDFDQLVCEPLADEPTAEGGVIPEEALLVHGCKDGSLHRLVIEENSPKKLELDLSKMGTPCESKAGWDTVIAENSPKVEKPIMAIPATASSSPSVNFATAEEVSEAFKEWANPVAAQTGRFDGTKPQKSNTPKKLKPTIATSPEDQQRVLAAIKTCEAPRINEIMEKTGLDKPNIKAILPVIGYESNGPGWIRKHKKKSKA